MMRGQLKQAIKAKSGAIQITQHQIALTQANAQPFQIQATISLQIQELTFSLVGLSQSRSTARQSPLAQRKLSSCPPSWLLQQLTRQSPLIT